MSRRGFRLRFPFNCRLGEAGVGGGGGGGRTSARSSPETCEEAGDRRRVRVSVCSCLTACRARRTLCEIFSFPEEMETEIIQRIRVYKQK